MNEIPEGMKALHRAIQDTLFDNKDDREAADALLAPDGLLWPALRALGRLATDVAHPSGSDEHRGRISLTFLSAYGVTGPLAAACLAAAEVQP